MQDIGLDAYRRRRVILRKKVWLFLINQKMTWSGMQGLCRDIKKYRSMDKKHKLDVTFVRLDFKKYNKF